MNKCSLHPSWPSCFLLQGDLDRFDNALFDPERQVAYRMRLRKGLFQQSEPSTTSWYSDIMYDLGDRYPMFAPVVQTWFNVYGEEAWLDPGRPFNWCQHWNRPGRPKNLKFQSPCR